MPELIKVITEDELTRGRGGGGGLDLAAYIGIIDDVREQGGVGGTVRLAEGENQRTEKRRLSVAAKERGYALTWRKSAPGELRFVLAAPGDAAPGGRNRRARAADDAAAPAPVATSGRKDGSTPAAAGGRGGRRRAPAKVNPIQVQKFLGGVDYPASKEDLVQAAEQHGADENVRAMLEQLPDEEYETPADVSQAMGQLK